jgi:hypothetical protein
LRWQLAINGEKYFLLTPLEKNTLLLKEHGDLFFLSMEGRSFHFLSPYCLQILSSFELSGRLFILLVVFLFFWSSFC